MAEPNGNQDNLTRLDRIEIAIEHVINEHEKLIDDHKFLLKAQVAMVDAVEKMGRRVDQTTANLDRMSREFHERLKRLEERQ